MKTYHFSDFLLESESNVLQALISQYGREQIYNREMSFNLTNEKLKKLYDILNSTFFNSKLPTTLPLYYVPVNEIISKLHRNHPQFDYSQINPLGMFTSNYVISTTEYDDVENVPMYKYSGNETIKFSNSELYINSSKIKNQTFIFTVNTICHEMIHCYDQYYGETTQCILKEHVYKDQGLIINPHTTPTFGYMIKEARKHKMKIIADLEKNYDFKKLNAEALELLFEGQSTTTSLVRGKDGKMYVDMSDMKQIGELYPLDNIHASWIHFD